MQGATSTFFYEPYLTYSEKKNAKCNTADNHLLFTELNVFFDVLVDCNNKLSMTPRQRCS